MYFISLISQSAQVKTKDFTQFVNMMEPMTESEAMETSSPSPPPVPSSPPPDEESSPSQSPPSKPKKTKRSSSPSKENGLLSNGSIENGEDDQSQSVAEKIDRNDMNGAATEGEKVNGYSNHKSEEEEESPDTSLGQGGVAKIVGEIEKYNSLSKSPKKSKDATASPQKTAALEEVHLRDASPDKPPKKLSPLEWSVLREMPVDVDIENSEALDTSRSPSKQSRSGRENGILGSEGEDSPRKGGTPVKRTPTMEFKKQCSKIVRIRTKVSACWHQFPM